MFGRWRFGAVETREKNSATSAGDFDFGASDCGRGDSVSTVVRETGADFR
jgi:hypothetical protein